MKKNISKNFDCNRGLVIRRFLMRENDVTPSNLMEMKGDITKKKKSKLRHAGPCSDLLQNNSRQFPIPSIGRLC